VVIEETVVKSSLMTGVVFIGSVLNWRGRGRPYSCIGNRVGVTILSIVTSIVISRFAKLKLVNVRLFLPPTPDPLRWQLVSLYGVDHNHSQCLLNCKHRASALTVNRLHVTLPADRNFALIDQLI